MNRSFLPLLLFITPDSIFNQNPSSSSPLNSLLRLNLDSRFFLPLLYKRYDEPPSLPNWKGTEGGRPPPIPEGIPLRRKTVVWPRLSVLSVSSIWEGGWRSGRNWRRYANNSRNAIAQTWRITDIQGIRGKGSGAGGTRLCGPARSAPLPDLLPYHGCGGSLECGSHIRHSATGVTSH